MFVFLTLFHDDDHNFGDDFLIVNVIGFMIVTNEKKITIFHSIYNGKNKKMSEIKTEHHVYQNDTDDDDDDDMTKNPLTESKNIDDNDDGGGQIEKHRSEKQFKWFMHAYISVAITIIGLLLLMIFELIFEKNASFNKII